MALSDWDKKNLNANQQRAVQTYTAEWEKARRAGDEARMQWAHNGAEAIRRQAGYSGGAAGNTFTAPTQNITGTTSTASNGRATYQTTQAGASKGFDNGSLTRAQVAQMQAALGVEQDGYFGPKTQAAAFQRWGAGTADSALRAYQSTATPARTSYGFDEDEGVYHWNGQTFASKRELTEAMNKANLSAAEKNILDRKAQGSDIQLQNGSFGSTMPEPTWEDPLPLEAPDLEEEPAGRGVVGHSGSEAPRSVADQLAMREQSRGDFSLLERLKSAVSGGAKNSASAYTNNVGNAIYGEAARQRQQVSGEVKAWQDTIDAYREVLNDPTSSASERDTARNVIADLERRIGAYESAYGTSGANERAAGTVWDAADRVSDSAAADIERAKESASDLEKLGVDLTVTGTQMLGDRLMSPIPGMSLVPMAARVLGSSSQEARRSGADFEHAMAYGGASAAVEVLSEQLFDGLAGLYGKGAADDIVKDVIDGLTKNETTRKVLNVIASGIGEGAEELISGLAAPALQTIWNGKGLGRNYSELEARDILYDVMVGGIMGGIGGTVEAVRGKPIYQQTTDETETEEPLRLPTAEEIENGIEPGQAATRPDAGGTEINGPRAGDLTSVQTGGAEAQKNASGEAEAVSLVQQVRNVIPAMNNAPAVASISGTEIPQKGTVVERLTAFANSIGNKINRPGFGDVLFSKTRIKNAFLGHGIGNAKIDAFAAVPAVIRNGQQIGYEHGWKGRGYDSYVFAAPIEYKGKRDYLGVIVTKDARDSRYYVHEVVDADGNLIFGEKENAGDTSDERATLPGAFGIVASPANSNATIAQPSNAVKSPAVPNLDTTVSAERVAQIQQMRETLEAETEPLRLQWLEAEYTLHEDFLQSLEPGDVLLDGDSVDFARVAGKDALGLTLVGTEGSDFPAAETILFPQRGADGSILPGTFLDGEPGQQWRGHSILDYLEPGSANGVPGGVTVEHSGGADAELAGQDDLLAKAYADAYTLGEEPLRLPTAEEIENGYEPGEQSYGRSFDEIADDVRYLPTAEEIENGYEPGSSAEYDQIQRRAGRTEAEESRKNNHPTRSKAHLRHDLISTFSVPEGSRATFASRIDAIAEEMLRDGRISDEHRAEMIRALYDAGVSVQEADPAYKAARDALKGRRIYVNESIRSELGDEWNELRRRAMGAGFYLTTDQSNGLGVDVVADELSGVLGNSIVNYAADGATQLRQMVEAASLGKNETISLAEEADILARQYGEGVREDQISNLERQFDDAMRRFAEKARLEVDLKARTDERVAREKELWREVFRKRDEARKQREAAAQTLRNLKRLRKRIGQNDMRLAEAMGQLSPEERKLAQDALGNLSTDAQRLTERAKAKMAENAARYEQLVENDPNYIPDKKTLALLERMDQKYLADLSASELMDIHRALQALEKHLSDMNKEIGKNRGEEFAVLYRDAKSNVSESKGRRKSGGVSRYLNEDQLTPMNYLEMLGGWDPDNTWTRTVAKQLEEGERARKRFIVEANEMLKDWREKHTDWIAKSDGQGKGATWYDITVPKLFAYDEMDHSPIFDGEETVHLTPAMRVELARGIRNDDNLRHAEGGVTFPDKELYSKGQRKEAYARGTTVKLAPETMKALFSYDNLTPEEKELFNLMDAFFDEKAKAAINDTSQQIDGIDRAISSHYSKIYTNANYRVTDATKHDESLYGMPSMQRRVFSRNPMLAMSVWEAFDDTVDTVSKYHGLAIPVRNVDMLFNWTEQGGGDSMKNVLSQKWGGDSVNYIEKLLRALQNPERREKSGFDALADKALNNYVTATFGMNPGIVLKQCSSFPSAAAVLGVDTIPSPRQIAKTDPKLIMKYTPELEYRSMGYATPELAELKNNPNWTQRNKATRFLFGGAIQGMDRLTVKAMWPWAENYVKKTSPELKAGSDAFYQKTAEVFNEAVTLTQPMYDVMHRAKILQDPSDLTRAFSMFKTVPMQQQNMLRKAIGEAQNAKGSGKAAANRNLARTVGSIVTANLLFEAIEFGNQLWKNAAKKYRDDDDELTMKSAGEEIVRSAIGDLAGMFLGGDELTDLVDIVSGKKSSYMSGLEAPGLSQIQDVITALTSAGKSIRKVASDTSDIVRNGGSVEEYVRTHGGDLLGDVKDLAETMSVYFAGVPVSNIERYLLGTLRAVSPKVEQEYKTLFDSTTKRDLSGLSGEALQVRVDDLLDNRVSNMSEAGKKELSRLYESTGVEVIPTDVPDHVTVDGEQRDLSASQMQTYQSSYAKTIDSELDKLLTGEAYRQLTDEQKAAAITSLYNYAKDTAKSAAIGTEKAKSTEKADTAQSMGLEPAKYFALKAQIGDLDELEGDEKAEAKLKLLRGDNLTDVEKSAAYYAISANEKEQKIIDDAPHLSLGQVTDALINLKIARLYDGETGARMQREALLNAMLPEQEKRDIYREMISDKHEEAFDGLARQGVDFDQWLDFEARSAGVKSTKDENGKDVKGQTKRDKLLAIIDSYDMSIAQKNAMYFAAGYAESTLEKAPWYNEQGAQPQSDFLRWLNSGRQTMPLVERTSG